MVMSIVEGEMGGKGGVVVADDLCIRSTESTDSCTGDFESHSTSPFVSDDHPLEMNHHRCSCPHHPPSRRGCGPQTLPSTLPPSDRCPPAPPSTTDKVRCRRRLSPFLRVPRASLAFLVFVSCLGVNLARPTSRHQGLSSQRQHYRDSQSRAMKYLAQFGYLKGPSRETFNLMSADHLTQAIKELQAMGGLPQTGVVDRATEELMKKPRCGNVDSTAGVIPGQGRSDLGQADRRRYRRYTEAPSKWSKTDLTYRLGNITRDMKEERVRATIEQAFELWSNATQLHFSRVNGTADIRIEFASGYHGDGFPFDDTGMILAHAFFPGAGRGGDTHFDDAEKWTSNSTDGVDLFMVAAHEFGHALGLAHSADPEALMYPWYQGFSGQFVLPEDDRRGIQKLYGAPQGERKFDSMEPDSSTPYPDYRPQGGDDKRPPDPCTTPFDAISIIRKDVFLFIGKWFWRLDSNNVLKDPVRIHKFWYGLPEDVTKVDAVVERPGDNRILFFSGDRFWIYNANRMQSGFPVEGRPITDFGIPGDVKHIDTVFTWGFNKRTYLVSGDMYWKLDENNTFVEYDYPRDMSIWRGVPVPLDAAFQYRDRKTYFFKGRSYWKFYDLRMRVDNMYPRAIAADWLKCSDVNVADRPFQQRKDEPQPPPSSAAAQQHHHAVWLCVFVMVCSCLNHSWKGLYRNILT